MPQSVSSEGLVQLLQHKGRYAVLKSLENKMPEIKIKGRLNLPSSLQGNEFQLGQLHLRRNENIVDGLEIALGLMHSDENAGTLAVLCLDDSSAREFAKALSDFMTSMPE